MVHRNFTLFFLGLVGFHAIIGSAHNDYSTEIELWRQKPVRRPGSLSVQPLKPGACNITCTIDARLTLDRFIQFSYVNYYQYTENMTGIYAPERAGIRTCEEVDASLACYEECNRNQTEMGNPPDEPSELKNLKSLKMKQCEGQLTNGYPSCRYTDVRHCDQRFQKTQCYDHFDGFYNCVDETLVKSHQDCSGVCTPARRFKLSNKFIWNMECRLARSGEQCKILASVTCFQNIKDADFNLGLYQTFTDQEKYANNLTALCDVLEAPLPCLDTLVNNFVSYHSFNLSRPCYPIRGKIEDIKNDWKDLIAPFCGHRQRELREGETIPTTFKDVCPDPEPLPVTPTTPHYHPIFTSPTTAEPGQQGGGNVIKFGPDWEEKKGICPSRPLAPGSDCSSCVADSECANDLKCCDSCCRAPRLARKKVKSGRGAGGSGTNTATVAVTLFLPVITYMAKARQLF